MKKLTLLLLSFAVLSSVTMLRRCKEASESIIAQ